MCACMCMCVCGEGGGRIDVGGWVGGCKREDV